MGLDACILALTAGGSNGLIIVSPDPDKTK
jgi:hypothetical protein